MARALKELDDIDAVFRALSHEQRRIVLTVLKTRGGEMTAGEIASRFECAWPTTSRHLRQLEQAGLVVVMQEGRERRYALNAGRLTQVAGKWIDWIDSKGKKVL